MRGWNGMKGNQHPKWRIGDIPADYVRRSERLDLPEPHEWVGIAITYALAGLIVGSISVYLFMA